MLEQLRVHACTCVHIHTQSPSASLFIVAVLVAESFSAWQVCFCPYAKIVKWDRSGVRVVANTSFFVLLFLFLNLLHFSFIATFVTSRFPLALLSTSRITLYGSDTQIQYYIHHSKLVEKVSDASTCIQMHCIDQA